MIKRVMLKRVMLNRVMLKRVMVGKTLRHSGSAIRVYKYVCV